MMGIGSASIGVSFWECDGTSGYEGCGAGGVREMGHGVIEIVRGVGCYALERSTSVVRGVRVVRGVGEGADEGASAVAVLALVSAEEEEC
jgi:hypothetical protein